MDGTPEMGGDLPGEPVLHGTRLYVHDNVHNRHVLLNHILANQGQIEDEPSRAGFCLVASYRHNTDEVIDRLKCLAGGVPILDESWIWQCLYLKQIIPWYQYVLKPASSRFEANYVKGLSLDTETRDLQELCTCLARHWPLVRQSDKPYDQIFSYLSEKFPHRSEQKFRDLYEKNMIPVSGCVGRLEKQFEAVFPPPESLFPIGSLIAPENTHPSNGRPSIPGLATTPTTDSLPVSVSGVNGKRAGHSTSTSLPRVGFQSGSAQRAAALGDLGNSPAPMPDMEDTARSLQPALNTNGPNSNTTQPRGQPASIARVNSSSHRDQIPQHNGVARDPDGIHPSLLIRGLGTTAVHRLAGHNVVAPIQLTGNGNSEVVPKTTPVPINSTTIEHSQSGALIRLPQKRKRQLDPDFEDSESTENEDDGDFVDTTSRSLLGNRENKRPHTDNRAGSRAPRFTDEELDHLKQWIVDHPHDNMQNTRMDYFVDFVKRSPIGGRRDPTSWQSAYYRLILPFEAIPSIPAAPRGRRRTMGKGSVVEHAVNPDAHDEPLPTTQSVEVMSVPAVEDRPL